MLRSLVIVEGVGSTFLYHLANEGQTTISLCFKATMPTSIPLSAWGFRGELHERYCADCAKHLPAKITHA